MLTRFEKWCWLSVNIKKTDAKPTWKILRNDEELQAVEFNDGILMAALPRTSFQLKN